MPAPTVTELVVDGFSEGGFRAEHALACALADASPVLKRACVSAIEFIEISPNSAEKDALLRELRAAVELASTPASRQAS